LFRDDFRPHFETEQGRIVGVFKLKSSSRATGASETCKLKTSCS